MKIVVVGIGFVGLSNAIVLAQNNHMIAVDISEEKVKCVNRGISPITDVEGSELLNSFVLDGTIGGKLASRSLIATTDLGLACLDADYVIIATPTDYDVATKKFDKPRRKTESGFRGIMLEMAAYWFSCLKVNEETLILTSTWDNDIFEGQYKKIIDSYTKTHNKKVFIIEVGPTGFFPRYPY